MIATRNDNEYGPRFQRLDAKPESCPRVAEQIHTGTVWVNCWLVRDLRVPFGGMKQSGVGREGGNEALHFFHRAEEYLHCKMKSSFGTSCSRSAPSQMSADRYRIEYGSSALDDLDSLAERARMQIPAQD